MAVALLASQCPAVQVPASTVYRNTTMDTTALVAPNIPGSVTWRKQANQLGAVLDQVARHGAGIFGIPDGPSAITLTAPGSGLLLQVSAGQGMIGGPVEIPVARTVSVPDDTIRVWIWLLRNGALLPLTTTTAPAGESCLLGSCVTSGGNITSIDTSGVVYLRGGIGCRATADDGVPSDTPPANIVLQTATAFCVYLWDGTGHRQQFVPAVTADPANPGANDQWYRTDLSQLMVHGSSASPIVADTNQSANVVKAGPTSGGAAAPGYRALVAADIPALAESKITNLVTDLAAKLAAASNLSDLASAASARTNLGLGSAALSASSAFAAASHTHAAADIVSGTVATARLGSGTANSGTFLRGDQTWAAPAASASSNPGELFQASPLIATDGQTIAFIVAAGISPPVYTLPQLILAGGSTPISYVVIIRNKAGGAVTVNPHAGDTIETASSDTVIATTGKAIYVGVAGSSSDGDWSRVV